jgi:hypothetical protein
LWIIREGRLVFCLTGVDIGLRCGEADGEMRGDLSALPALLKISFASAVISAALAIFTSPGLQNMILPRELSRSFSIV